MDKTKFDDYLICPDILDDPPKDICDVVFESGAKAVLGNELQAKDVKNQPIKVDYPTEKDAFYTIMIADVDTQNPDKNQGITQWQQWIVVNIPEKDISKGQVLSEYIGSGPLPGTGLHRYAVLVYKQRQGQIAPKEPYFSNTDGDRKGFSVRDFTEKYSLGKPVAANFYQCKYDESVRELYHKQS